MSFTIKFGSLYWDLHKVNIPSFSLDGIHHLLCSSMSCMFNFSNNISPITSLNKDFYYNLILNKSCLSLDNMTIIVFQDCIFLPHYINCNMGIYSWLLPIFNNNSFKLILLGILVILLRLLYELIIRLFNVILKINNNVLLLFITLLFISAVNGYSVFIPPVSEALGQELGLPDFTIINLSIDSIHLWVVFFIFWATTTIILWKYFRYIYAPGIFIDTLVYVAAFYFMVIYHLSFKFPVTFIISHTIGPEFVGFFLIHIYIWLVYLLYTMLRYNDLFT